MAIRSRIVWRGKGSLKWLGWLVFSMPAGAAPSEAEVVRGPYLQSLTQTNLVVQWRTSIPTRSRVAFGLEPGSLVNEVSNTTAVTNHSIMVPGLEPGTQYFYGVGDEDGLMESGDNYHFTTLPASPQPVRIWALGDVGTASQGEPAPAQVLESYRAFTGSRATDVWLLLGDNAYSTGTDDEYQAAIFDVFGDMLRNTPVWSTVGNHETYSYVPNQPWAYAEIFLPPLLGQSGGVASGSLLYYSFDVGNTHFVCLDSELSDNKPGSPMMQWLEADLLSNSKDWLIAFWHSPPYTKGSHNSDRTSDSGGNLFEMRTNVVPVLEAHGVDLVLGGHSHNYERSYLVDGHYGTSTTLQPSMLLDAGTGRPGETGAYLKSGTGPAGHQGTVYIVAGSSGWATFVTGRHPIMCEQFLRVGSLVLDIDGQRLDATFLADNGEILDTFTMLKNTPPAPFRIVGYQLAQGLPVLSWKSQAGKVYQVEHTPGLTPIDWQAISGEITATGATTTWTNTMPELSTEGFHRVTELVD